MFFVCDICFLLGEDRLASHVQYTMRQKSCILAIESLQLNLTRFVLSGSMGSERVAYRLSVTWYRSEHLTWLCCDKKIRPKTGCQKLGLVVHNGLKRQKKSPKCT